MNHNEFVKLSLGYIKSRFDNHYSLKNLSIVDEKLKVNIWTDELQQFEEKLLTYNNLKQTISYYVDITRANCTKTNNNFNLNKPPSIDDFTYCFRQITYQQKQQKILKIEQKKELPLKERWATSSTIEKKNIVFNFLKLCNYEVKAMPLEYKQWILKNKVIIGKELKQYKIN